MKSQNDEQQKAQLQIYEIAENLMINQKRSASETIDVLIIDYELSEEQAIAVVANLEDAINEELNYKANRNILHGSLWCIGGTIVTVVSYQIALENGGTYWITWGAILFGALQLLNGLLYKMTNGGKLSNEELQ